jgi:hypothetical protein
MIRSMPTRGASDVIANTGEYREWLKYLYAVLSALKHPNSRTIVYLRGLARGNWRGADCDAPVATRDSAGVVVLAFTCLQVAEALDGFVFMYGDDGQRRNLAGKLGACYGAIVEALRNPAFRVPTHLVGREKGEFSDSFEHWMLRTSPPTTRTPGNDSALQPPGVPLTCCPSSPVRLTGPPRPPTIPR